MEINQEVKTATKKQNKIVSWLFNYFERQWRDRHEILLNALIIVLYAFSIASIVGGVVLVRDVNSIVKFDDFFEQNVYALMQVLILVIAGVGGAIIATLLKIYQEIKKKNN